MYQKKKNAKKRDNEVKHIKIRDVNIICFYHHDIVNIEF